MKLHLPVKLRASLMAAVAAVSFLAYNAQAALTTVTPPGTDTSITIRQATLSGYSYQVVGTGGGIVVGSGTTTTEGVISTLSGNFAFVTDNTVSFMNSTKSTVDKFEGDIDIQANRIDIADNSVVILEDVSIAGYSAGTVPDTSIGDKSMLVILNGPTSDLSDVDIERVGVGNISTPGCVYDHRTVSLGDVDGEGSLVFIASGEGTSTLSATSIKGVSGVDSFGEVCIVNGSATIGGDVSDVNAVKLVASKMEVGGLVRTQALYVSTGSSLQAVDSISTVGHDVLSTSIAGSVVSTTGEIELGHGKIYEGATVVAEKESISLSHIEATNALKISAEKDLWLGASSLDGCQTVYVGGNLTLNEIDGISSTINGSKIQKVGGYVEVKDGSKITGSELDSIGGYISVTDGSTISASKLLGIGTGDITIDASEVDSSTITTGTGAITIENDSTVTSSTISTEAGAITIDDSAVTSSTISNNGDGDISVTNSTVTAKSTISSTGAGAITIDDSEVASSTISTGTGAIAVKNNSTVTSSTISTGAGAITIDDSAVTFSTITSNGAGNIEIADSTITSSTVTTENGSLSISNSTVEKNGTTKSVIIAQNNSTIDSSTISGADITVSNGNLTVGGTAASGLIDDVNLTVGATLKVTGGSTLKLDSGSSSNASVTANKFELENLAGNVASLTNAKIMVDAETLIHDGNELTLSNVSGALRDLRQTQETGKTAKVDITNGSVISIKEISTKDATDVNVADSYFDTINVADSQVTVAGKALVNKYTESGDSKVVFQGDAYLTSADIDAITTVQGDAHIGNLDLKAGGTLNLQGPAISYIANITTDAGKVNVVNGTLTTPVLNSENLTLGLSGGKVVLDSVAAADGARVGSTALVTPHVVLAAVTDASDSGASGTGRSSIATAASLNRVSEPAYSSEGDSATQAVNTHYFYVTEDVTLNGNVCQAGSIVAVPDYIASSETIENLGDRVTDVEWVLDGAIQTGKLLQLSNLQPDLDENGDPKDDENGKFVWIATTDGVSTKIAATLSKPYGEIVDSITYYPNAAGGNGELTPTSNGIASLTVKGDFSANSTDINAYETGTEDTNGLVTPDAGTGFISIGGQLKGQDNKLTADNDITITGGINAATKGDQNAHNILISNRGNIFIGTATAPAELVDNYLEATATLGSVTTGDITGSNNKLTANTTVTTGDITGSSNKLAATLESVTTGDIQGSSNELAAAQERVTTGSITGSNNKLTANTTVTTRDITGSNNELTATLESVTTGDITDDSNKLTANTTVTTGDITGSNNELTATLESVTTGAITGDSNKLTANTSIKAEAVSGKQNELKAGTSIEVASVSGSSNKLIATAPSVDGEPTIKVTGTVEGNLNELDAAEGDIAIGGLKGEGNSITAKDGSISIKTLAALDVEAPDVNLANTISAKTGSVSIDELTGSKAITKVEATAVTLGSGSAENLTITDVLTRTEDSTAPISNTITITDKVELGGDSHLSAAHLSGDTLTLSGNTYGKVGYVNLTDLTMKDDAHLDVYGSVKVDNLTMIGDNAWLLADDVTVTTSLSLQDGAALKNASLELVNVKTIEVIGNGTVLETQEDLTKVDASLIVGDGGQVDIGGDLSVQDITITDGDSVEAKSITTGKIEINGGELSTTTGDLTANSVQSEGGDIDIAGDVTLTDSLKAENTVMKSGDIVLNGEFKLTGDQTSNIGDVTGAQGATLGNVKMGDLKEFSGKLVAADSSIGKVSMADGATITSIELTDGTMVDDNLVTSGSAEVTDSTIAGSLTAGSATVKDSQIGGITVENKLVASGRVESSNNVTAGSLELTDGSLSTTNNAGTVSVANDAILTNAQVNTSALIGQGGTLTMDHAEVSGDVSGFASTEVMSFSSLGSLDTDNLSLAEDAMLVATAGDVGIRNLTMAQGSELKATNGNISANGLINVSGDITANDEHTVSLVGAAGSSIAGSDIKANTVELGGELTMADSLVRADSIALLPGGTVNVENGTELSGTISGTGTLNLNKTDGSVFRLASASNLNGGKVNVNVGTLDVAAGANAGSVSVAPGSTLIVAGDGTTGEITANVVLANGSSLKMDVDLGGDSDVIHGNVDMGNNNLSLHSLDRTAENAVADGTKLGLVQDGVVTNMGSDVNHDFVTLNAHVDPNGNIILSKNYKVAAETANEQSTSSALSGIDQTTIAGHSDLAKVFDALNHTQSAGAARQALQSLGGAGMTAAQKAVLDDSAEHLRIMRSTMLGMSTGTQYKQDTSCCRSPQSPLGSTSAITGSITGGSTSVSGSNGCGDYDRNSIGFMLALVHAVSNETVIGVDLAASFIDASCGNTDIDATVFYADFAVMNRSGRLGQTGSFGFGVFDIDTERRVSVSADNHSYSGTAQGSTEAVVVNFSYEITYDLVNNGKGTLISLVGLGEGTIGKIDDIVESGLGNAGLKSEFDTVAGFTLGAGFRFAQGFSSAPNPGFFVADALLVVDGGERTPRVTNTFIGGGGSYRMDGPESGTVGLRLNAGILIPLDDSIGIFGNVTSEFRSDQTYVGGNVGLRVAF